jgi:hypothetical protein
LIEVEEYCREVETYLCRKNDGHLIRIVGPSFERVSGWAQQGVALKLVYRGIDRYFERYYSKGPRRRPVRIDFCEADVLDVFDEWRRAVGIVGTRESGVGSQESRVESRESLPAHLERVVMRLTQARAKGSIGGDLDGLVDRVAGELDAARAVRLRGAARQAVIDRLAALDAELLDAARGAVDGATRASLDREAEEELAAFRSAMPPLAFAAAREAAVNRLIRERLALPTIAFTAG